MKESISHIDTTHSKKQMTIILIWRQVISSYMQGVCIHVAIVVRGLLSEQASKIHPVLNVLFELLNQIKLETKFVIRYAAEMQLDVNLNIITSKGAITLPSLLSLAHTSWIFWGRYTFHQPQPELLFSFSQISVRCFSTPQVRISSTIITSVY